MKKGRGSGMTWTGLDRVGNGYRLCALRDLNGWIADRERACITGAFGVPGENENGKESDEFCAEKGLCESNAYFQEELT